MSQGQGGVCVCVTSLSGVGWSVCVLPLSQGQGGVCVKEGQLLLQAADSEGQVAGGQDEEHDAEETNTPSPSHHKHTFTLTS